MDNFVEITIDYDVYDKNGRFLRKDFEIFKVMRGSISFRHNVKNVVVKECGINMQHEYWVPYCVSVEGI